MARIFITGSSDGLGLMCGELLAQEHEVVLHARNEDRARKAQRKVPRSKVVIGDVSTLRAMRDVAGQANAIGPYDAVIHNVAVGFKEARHVTEDGIEQLFAINTLAPYVLTALIHKPKRLVYLSSGMHRSGETRMDDLMWERRPWNGSQAYATSKLHDVLLAFGVARRWPDVYVNAVTPGWVATKMGGEGAPDDLAQAHLTQCWLAVSDDEKAKVTAQLLYHQKPFELHKSARDEKLQDELLARCAELSGVALPT